MRFPSSATRVCVCVRKENEIKLGNQLRWSRASPLILFFHRTTDLICARRITVCFANTNWSLLFIYLFVLFFTKKIQLNWPHFNRLIVVHSFCDRDLSADPLNTFEQLNKQFILRRFHFHCHWIGLRLLFCFCCCLPNDNKGKNKNKTVIKRNWAGFGGKISSHWPPYAKTHTGALIYWHLRGTVWHDYYEFPCKTLKHYNSFQVIKAKNN